jgi:hypothetical protein
MSRVLCVCSPDEADVLRSALETESQDVDLMVRERSEDVLDEVMAEHPDVLVYELRPDSQADLAVLWLVNHVAPRLPVVLVGDALERATPLPPFMVRHIHGDPPALGEIRAAVEDVLHARDRS